MSLPRPAPVIAGAAYVLVPGLLFAELAGRAATMQARFGWRLAAWILSLLLFAAHLAHERFRLRRTPRATAGQVALGVALGGCALAAAALVRSLVTGTGKPVLLAIALVAWPVLLGLPAYLVAWGAAAVFKPGMDRPS